MCDNESVCVSMGGMHETTPVVPDSSSLGFILHHTCIFIPLSSTSVCECVVMRVCMYMFPWEECMKPQQ